MRWSLSESIARTLRVKEDFERTFHAFAKAMEKNRLRVADKVQTVLQMTRKHMISLLEVDVGWSSTTVRASKLRNSNETLCDFSRYIVLVETFSRFVKMFGVGLTISADGNADLSATKSFLGGENTDIQGYVSE